MTSYELDALSGELWDFDTLILKDGPMAHHVSLTDGAAAFRRKTAQRVLPAMIALHGSALGQDRRLYGKAAAAAVEAADALAAALLSMPLTPGARVTEQPIHACKVLARWVGLAAADCPHCRGYGERIVDLSRRMGGDDCEELDPRVERPLS